MKKHNSMSKNEIRKLVNGSFERKFNGGTQLNRYNLHENIFDARALPLIITEIDTNKRSKEEVNMGMFIGQNKLGYKGAKYLFKGRLSNMAIINLIGNHIGNKGCLWLSKGNWPDLNQIGLNNNLITFQGCAHLAKADWPSLFYLEICENRIGNEGYKAIREAFKAAALFCDPQYQQLQ